MRALQVTSEGVAVNQVDVPRTEKEALVKVLLSGICNTDIEIARGYAGFQGTIGHEFVGIVERCEADPGITGKRVVGEINVGCGFCEKCLSADPRHCLGRTVLGIVGRDGAHAQYLALPRQNLILVPDAIPNEQAVFAEPLAAALGIWERVPSDQSSRIAVVGDGKLGLLCALSALQKSEAVTVVGRHERKLSIAAAWGAAVTDRPDELRREFDIVVEASGSAGGFQTSVDLVKPRGTIVLKSTFEGSRTWPASRIVVDEITVVGSRCGRLGQAIELLSSGSFDLRALIDDEFTLADGASALKKATEKGVLKVLLRP